MNAHNPLCVHATRQQGTFSLGTFGFASTCHRLRHFCSRRHVPPSGSYSTVCWYSSTVRYLFLSVLQHCCWPVTYILAYRHFCSRDHVTFGRAGLPHAGWVRVQPSPEVIPNLGLAYRHFFTAYCLLGWAPLKPHRSAGHGNVVRCCCGRQEVFPFTGSQCTFTPWLD